MFSVADLICGTNTVSMNGDMNGLARRFRDDIEEIDTILFASVSLREGVPSWAVMPFLMRKFLELSATSLLFRLDPLRVLAARKNQLHSSYETGRQNASSIAWTGDIFPGDRATTQDIWDAAMLKKGPERSLLGWHVGNVAIVPGLQSLGDAGVGSSTWLAKLADIENPFEWIKGQLSQLYSTFSKGIHAEYLLDDQNAFDQASIEQHLSDVYMVVGILAAATHYSPLFSKSLSHDDALRAMLDVEEGYFRRIGNT